MARRRSIIAMLFSGRTNVPDFVGLTWLDAGVTAVRHRVVRDACPLATVTPSDSLSTWTVVDQDPCPGTTVPMGTSVVLYVLPQVASRIIDAPVVAGAEGSASSDAQERGSAEAQPRPCRAISTFQV